MQAVSSPESDTSANNADHSTSSSADELTFGDVYTSPSPTSQQQMSMVTDTPHPIGQAYSGAQKQPAAVRLSSVLFSGTCQPARPDAGPKTPILSAPDLRPGIRQRIQQVAEQSIICIRGASQGYAAAPAPATAASMQPITAVSKAAYLLPGSKARLRTQWPSARSASAVPQPLTQPLPASAPALGSAKLAPMVQSSSHVALSWAPDLLPNQPSPSNHLWLPNCHAQAQADLCSAAQCLASW